MCILFYRIKQNEKQLNEIGDDEKKKKSEKPKKCVKIQNTEKNT